MASVTMGILCFLCGAALFWAPKPERAFSERRVLRGLAETAKDVWQMARRRAGVLALVLCFLPIGSGAAPFSAVATEWKASADMVALVTGALSGVVSAAGCLAGGWACDRMDRKGAYLWAGLLQAASAIAMALFPRTQLMYILWDLIYMFTSGLAYAAFSAFVLEAIGRGAAATKYNALASLSNVPIYYMTIIDGAAHDRWNTTGMFFTEAGLAAAAAVIFVVLARFLWTAQNSQAD